MKCLSSVLALFVVLTFSLAPPQVRAQDGGSVSFQVFYDQLGSQGNWIQTDSYGYVFQPNVTDPNWAPYSQGNWVNTPSGWAWVSAEPWGWATYHYGRWANIDGTGWVWVPGYQWAPAWVSWRYGGGYAGWAPLPPPPPAYGGSVGVGFSQPGVSVGLNFNFGGDVDVSLGIGAGCYNFVPVANIGAPNCRPYIVNRYNNYGIINRTTNITNITVNKTVNNTTVINNYNGVSAGGPPINEINAHAKQKIQTVNLTSAAEPGRSTLQGNSLAVYAPRIDPATAQQARPARVAKTISHPTFNRGDSITKPLEVTSTVKPPPPTPAMIRKAQRAQAHTPAKAHIATSEALAHTTEAKPVEHTAANAEKPEVKSSTSEGEKPPVKHTSTEEHNAAKKTEKKTEKTVHHPSSETAAEKPHPAPAATHPEAKPTHPTAPKPAASDDKKKPDATDKPQP